MKLISKSISISLVLLKLNGIDNIDCFCYNVGMKTLKPMKANKGVEMEYRKRLDKLLDAMNKSVLYWILADYGNRTAKEMARAIQKRIKQWDKVFGSKAEDIAIWFATTVKKHTEIGFRTALRGVGINRYPSIPNNVVNAVELENEDLIRSIPEKYFLGISTVAMMAIMYDWSADMLQKEIEKRHGITWRRIRTIARDQTHKTNELYKKAICDNLGIKYARWVYTWRSETQRESHVAADGRLFDISKGCLIDGEYIFPGELINCNCSFAPVIEEPGDEEEIKREIEKNRYYRKIARGDKK